MNHYHPTEVKYETKNSILISTVAKVVRNYMNQVIYSNLLVHRSPEASMKGQGTLNYTARMVT